MIVKCNHCDGTGEVRIDEPKLSLSDLLEPFLLEDMIGFRLKAKPDASIERLPAIEKQEWFADVVEKIHGEE